MTRSTRSRIQQTAGEERHQISWTGLSRLRPLIDSPHGTCCQPTYSPPLSSTPMGLGTCMDSIDGHELQSSLQGLRLGTLACTTLSITSPSSHHQLQVHTLELIGSQASCCRSSQLLVGPMTVQQPWTTRSGRIFTMIGSKGELIWAHLRFYLMLPLLQLLCCIHSHPCYPKYTEGDFP